MIGLILQPYPTSCWLACVYNTPAEYTVPFPLSACELWQKFDLRLAF